MAQTADLTPPIDATLEFETIGFDFGLAMAATATITSVQSLTCTVHGGGTGTDATPSSRLIGGSTIVPSKATGLASQAVAQQFGNAVAGVKYLLQCVANTSDGQKLSLWARIDCVLPT